MSALAAPFNPDISLTLDEFKRHFQKVMAVRKAEVDFDRFESASVTSDGLRLHLDVIETEVGRPTVVFVPGTSVYGLIFADFLAALADSGLNVVSVDPRGHGRSEGRRGDYSVPWLVADAKAAIAYARERFDGPIYTCGSSQGGIVAFYLAATDENLAGSICHNAADLADARNAELTDHPRIAKLLRPVVLALAAIRPQTQINMQKYYALLSRGDQQIKQWLAADPLALKVITLRALASLTTTPLDRPVEQIKTPVLLLHGAKDNMFPQAFIEGIYGRLTCDKAIKVYPGVGHFLITNHAQQSARDVVEWIDQRTPITAG